LQHSTRGGHSSFSTGHSKAPTLKECEAIIHHLEAKSKKQAHELVQIKADLRDVLYSHKWTPDAFLMARAYVSEDSSEHFRYSIKIVERAKRVT
jgi:hypothetical protein